MLKDILTLMLAIVLSFTTGGSVQDEKMNDACSRWRRFTASTVVCAWKSTRRK